MLQGLLPQDIVVLAKLVAYGGARSGRIQRAQCAAPTLEPLHKMVPAVARKDPALYELLALIDALRDGRVRERHLAEKELSVRLQSLRPRPFACGLTRVTPR